MNVYHKGMRLHFEHRLVDDAVLLALDLRNEFGHVDDDAQ